MTRLLLLFLLIVALFSSCLTLNVRKLTVYAEDPQNPAIQSTITQEGFDYFTNVGIVYLQASLANLAVPDASGTDHSPVGKIKWNIKNMQLTELNMGNSSITIQPAVGLALDLKINVFKMKADWHYEHSGFPHISDHGSLDVNADDADVSVGLGITAANYRPVLSVTSDSVHFNKLDIKVHGGASWLYNFLIKQFHGNIQHSIEKSLQDAISKNIDNGINNVLSTMNVDAHIDHHTIDLNLGILGQPVFQPSFMTIPESGEFYNVANPVDCPDCQSWPLPSGTSDGNMVQISFSEYVVNSATYVYDQLGLLNVLVTPNEVPPSSPIQLNTTAFQYLIPGLYAKYPDMLMQLKIYPTVRPQFTFSPQGLTTTAPGNIEFDVITGDNAIQQAFVLNGTIFTGGTATVINGLVIGNLTYLKGDFGIVSSNVGDVNVNVLESLLNFMFNAGVIPAVNKKIGAGIPLPTVQGLSFVNPTISWGSHVATISTSVSFVPS